MDAFFILIFVGPVSVAPPGNMAGGACAYPPYKRSSTRNLQTKKKTSFDVFLLEYWYRGWDSNPQAR